MRESFDISHMKKIGEGTEGIVLTDGEFSYKIVKSDLVGEVIDINNKVSIIDHPNIVKIYNAWYLDDTEEYVVIKMEILEELPDVENMDEFDRVRRELWETEDNITMLRRIKSSDVEVQRMVDSIISAYEKIGRLDVGFHNLMYDPKTNNYKQIDII